MYYRFYLSINSSGLILLVFLLFSFLFKLVKNIHGYHIYSYFFSRSSYLTTLRGEKGDRPSWKRRVTNDVFSSRVFSFRWNPSRWELCTQPGQRISRLLYLLADPSRIGRFQFSPRLFFPFSFSPPQARRGRGRETRLIFEISFWPVSKSRVHSEGAFLRCNQSAVDDKSDSNRANRPVWK